MRRIVLGGAGLGAAILVLLVVFAVSLRTKFSPVMDAVRRMNRALINPRVLKTAGQPGAAASVVRHVGRTSGSPYQTPVGAAATDDGFVIALPYGTKPDWLKNVLAAGSATIVNEGETHRVDRPQLVDRSTGNAYFSPEEQRTHRLAGIDDFLLLRRAVTEKPAGDN